MDSPHPGNTDCPLARLLGPDRVRSPQVKRTRRSWLKAASGVSAGLLGGVSAASAHVRFKTHRVTHPKPRGRHIANSTADAHELAPSLSNIPTAIISAIRFGAFHSGMPATFLMAVAWFESRLNPNARLRNAVGLFQFEPGTWLALMRHARIASLAPRPAVPAMLKAHHGIVTGPRWAVQEILGWRRDPHLAAVGAALGMERGVQALHAQFGLHASMASAQGRTDAYLIHAFGLGGAAVFVKAARSGSRSVIPASVLHANPGLLRGRTAMAAYADLTKRIETCENHYRRLLSSADPFEIPQGAAMT